MAFLARRMIWEFGYRRSKMEKIYRRIRTVYTIANTARKALGIGPSGHRQVERLPLATISRLRTLSASWRHDFLDLEPWF